MIGIRLGRKNVKQQSLFLVYTHKVGRMKRRGRNTLAATHPRGQTFDRARHSLSQLQTKRALISPNDHQDSFYIDVIVQPPATMAAAHRCAPAIWRGILQRAAAGARAQSSGAYNRQVVVIASSWWQCVVVCAGKVTWRRALSLMHAQPRRVYPCSHLHTHAKQTPSLSFSSSIDKPVCLARKQQQQQ